MFSSAPIITNVGKTLLLRAAGGEKITFTKFQVGSGLLGENESPETRTALVNAVLTNIGINQSQSTGQDGYIQLTGIFDNQTDIQTNFLWTELGLFAKDEDDVEYLYAYGYDNKNAETLISGGTAVITEQTVSMIIAIGDSQNITAYVLPNATYATKAEFNNHVAAKNPHGTGPDDIGAAHAKHDHSTNDITSGVLPVARGGTGKSTTEEMRSLFAPVSGMYEGNGATQRDINLGFHPNVVIYTDEGGTFSDDVKGSTGGIILRDYPHYTWDVGYGSSRSDGQKVAEITSTGFRVYSNGGNGHNGRRPNQNGIRYFYIAW